MVTFTFSLMVRFTFSCGTKKGMSHKLCVGFQSRILCHDSRGHSTLIPYCLIVIRLQQKSQQCKHCLEANVWNIKHNLQHAVSELHFEEVQNYKKCKIAGQSPAFSASQYNVQNTRSYRNLAVKGLHPVSARINGLSTGTYRCES